MDSSKESRFRSTRFLENTFVVEISGSKGRKQLNQYNAYVGSAHAVH